MKNNRFFRWLRGEKDIWHQIGKMMDEHGVQDHIAEELAHKEKELRGDSHAAEVELQAFGRIYPVLSVVLCVIFSLVLILTVTYLPRYGEVDAPVNNEVSERYIEKGLEETGAVNIVAGMILDYRAFDTLGESHVLFTGLCAVMLLLMETGDRRKRREEKREDELCDLKKDVIVVQIVRFLLPFVMLFGIYVILNGHLSPGGGFSGGAIIGAGLILHSIAYGFEKTEKLVNFKVFRTISLCALLFYSCAKGYSFYMGAHHLENGISLGIPGHIISAGLILPLNIAVGLVVSCTMYGIYSLFRRGRI